MLNAGNLALPGAPHRLQNRFANVTGPVQAPFAEGAAEGIERERSVS